MPAVNARAMGKSGASQILPGNGGEMAGRGWSTSAGGIGFGGVVVMLTPSSPDERAAIGAVAYGFAMPRLSEHPCEPASKKCTSYVGDDLGSLAAPSSR